MKINLLKKTFLLFLLLSVIFSFSLVFANETPQIEPRTISEETTEIQGDESENNSNNDTTYITSDLFLYDTNVEVSQTVNGNVAIYGQTVSITGEIFGDLIVLADSLEISEDAMIYGNILAYSPNFTFSGIASDIYALSSNFTLESTGIVDRNLNIYSTNVTINGKVSRDANICTANLNFGESENALIEGNLNYWANSEFTIPDESVSGSVNYSQLQSANTGDIIWSIASSIITGLVFSFIFIMLSIWISPEFKNRLDIIKEHSFKTFGIGLLVIFCIIVGAIFLLLFTFGFGTTSSIALVALLVLALSISNTVFSMSIAKLITNKLGLEKNTPFVLFSLLFVLILALVEYIPYVGIPINLITAIIGLGLLSINFYKRRDLTLPQNTK